MSYITYRLIHFLGIFTLLTVTAATGMHGLRGGTRADHPARRFAGWIHGIALLLILVGGFGMLARLGILQSGLPPWVIVKLTIWLLFGGAMTLAYRGRRLSRALLIALPLLALAAGGAALYKPS